MGSRPLTREELIIDFLRTGRITIAMMCAAAEIDELSDDDAVPGAEDYMVFRIKQITGLDVSRQYVRDATFILLRTEKFVEEAQLNDSATEH